MLQGRERIWRSTMVQEEEALQCEGWRSKQSVGELQNLALTFGEERAKEKRTNKTKTTVA